MKKDKLYFKCPICGHDRVFYVETLRYAYFPTLEKIKPVLGSETMTWKGATYGKWDGLSFDKPGLKSISPYYEFYCYKCEHDLGKHSSVNSFLMEMFYMGHLKYDYRKDSKPKETTSNPLEWCKWDDGMMSKVVD